MSRIVLAGIWLLIVLCLPLAALRMLWAVIVSPTKALEQAKAFDKTGNALANGDPNEYISTRAYRAMQERRRWGCILCRLLDLIEKDHCKKSANP